MAWHATEVVRSTYNHTNAGLALEVVTQLGADLQDTSCPPEICQLGRTFTKLRTQVAAWHHAHVSTGPSEAANNLAMRVKRIAFGFTSQPQQPEVPTTMGALSPDVFDKLTDEALAAFDRVTGLDGDVESEARHQTPTRSASVRVRGDGAKFARRLVVEHRGTGKEEQARREDVGEHVLARLGEAGVAR